MDLPILAISDKWNHSVCSLADFFSEPVFQVHLCCGMDRNFTPFCGQVIFHGVGTLHLLIHSSVSEHLDGFYILAIKNNVTMNIHVQVFVCTCIINFVEYTPSSGVARLYGNSMFNVWGIARLFHSSCAICFPTSSVWAFQSPHIFTDTCYCLSHSSLSVCKVVSPRSFDLYVPND